MSELKTNDQEWEWVTKYRVWVANRKVFLYPENWLDPEIRDKSIPTLLVILLIVAGVIFIIAHHRSKNV